MRAISVIRSLFACAMLLVVITCKPAVGVEPAPARIKLLDEMSSTDVAALDTSRTIFILPVDPLEAHGPHLPTGTDVLTSNEIARRTAVQVTRTMPAWTVVMMPTLSYGVGGANEIPQRPDIRGTFGLRATTLRDLVVDLGEQIHDNGFRWLFVGYVHGAAHHHAAVNDATDFLREVRHVSAVNLGGIERYLPKPLTEEYLRARFTAEQMARVGFDIHAGMSETSRVLAIRPDLVHPHYRQLPDRTVRNWQELDSIGRSSAFVGYWSAPSLAESEFGEIVIKEKTSLWADVVVRAIRGEEMTLLARYPERESIEDANFRSALRELNRQRASRLQLDRWLLTRTTIIR